MDSTLSSEYIKVSNTDDTIPAIELNDNEIENLINKWDMVTFAEAIIEDNQTSSIFQNVSMSTISNYIKNFLYF